MLTSSLLFFALALQPITVSGNFPRDLLGPVDLRDTRPTACAGGLCIWGRADSDTLPIQFHAPAGYRVRILAIRGDLSAWVKRLPGEPPLPSGSSAGVLAAFQVPATGPSSEADYCDRGAVLYVQDSLTSEQPKTRVALNWENLNFLLGTDNTLIAKVAEFLNTMEKPIHLELTWVISFQFEVTP